MRATRALAGVAAGIVVATSVAACSSTGGKMGDRVVGSDVASSEATGSAESTAPQSTTTEASTSEAAPAEQDFVVESGFTTGVDSIGTRYTSAGARLTNPNSDLAAYGVQVLFNLVDAKGDVLDSTTENVPYVGPGETVPVAPLQIGFDLKKVPTELEVQVVGDFVEDEGPRDSFDAPTSILKLKDAEITRSDYSLELSGQVTNQTDELVTEATWACIYVKGKKIVGGASSAIIDPIPPGSTVHFGDFVSVDALAGSSVECRILSGY